MKKCGFLTKTAALALTASLFIQGAPAFAAGFLIISDAPGAVSAESSGSASELQGTAGPVSVSGPVQQADRAEAETSELKALSAPEDYYTGPGVGLPASDGISSVSGPGGSSQPSASGSSGSTAGRAGINHAGDQTTVVDLGFKIAIPNVSKGSMAVAEGSVQLSDGSWAYIGHELNIRGPYYRVLREVTDSQGVDWYVCAASASKIGDYYTADGSLVKELWLKKSDCREMSSITLNTTNQTRINIVKTAIANLGDDYTYGMTGPDEFDCSGFVNYVFAQAGISVPRQSTAICQMSGQISIEDLRPGDIVGRSGHVGVYIGDGIFVHSSETVTGVISEYVDVYNANQGFTNYINAVGD